MDGECRTRDQLLAEIEFLRGQLAQGGRASMEGTGSGMEEVRLRWSRLIEAMDEAVFIVGPDRREILNANHAAVRFLGYKRQELLQLRVHDLYSGMSAARNREIIQKLLSKGHVRFEQIQKKDGMELPVSVDSRVIDYGGRMAFYSIVRRIGEENRSGDGDYRLGLDRIISALAMEFMRLGSHEIDGGIDRALALLGEYVGVDRAYVFQFDKAGVLATNTHEWCREGIEPRISRLQGILMDEKLPWLARRIRNMEDLVIPSVAELPEEASREKAHFVEQGILSLVTVPMVREQDLTGFVGFDFVRAEAPAPREAWPLLRMMGVLFGDALHRKRTEESLARSEERYRAYVELAPDGIVILDPRGVCLEVNIAASRITGYSKEELAGSSFLDLVPEWFRQTACQRFQRLKETGSLRGEGSLCRKDGSELWIAFDAVKLPGGNFLTHCKDVTERKEAESRLKKLNALLEQERNLFFTGPVVTFKWRAVEGWPVDYVSPNVTELLGYTAPEFLSGEIPYADLVVEADLAEVTNEVKKYTASGVSRFEHKPYRLRKKNGEFVWVADYTTILRDQQGRVQHYLGYLVDVTQRMQAEEEQRCFETHLRQVQKLESLGVLASGIAHDFNNILMAILGNTDLAMLHLPDDSKAQGYLREIESSSRRAAQLVRQMLAYSGKGKFVVEPINLSAFIQEMLHFLKLSISKSALLKLDFEPDLPAFEGDKSQIRQVLVNLVTNASEAIADRSGLIAIRTGALDCKRDYLKSCYLDEGQREGIYVYVEVADTGCGIPQKSRKQIFDPFFTTKFAGRGLGLAALLGIVRSHRGAIRIESQPEVGTTFRILFPAAESAKVVEKSRAFLKSAILRRGKILVVDDEETIRGVAKYMLELAGFEVLLAVDGCEAVEIYQRRRHEIACVLLDLTMPHMDGLTALEKMRNLDKNVRVILSSGYNRQELADELASGGAVTFLAKPYRFKELLAKLEELLG